MTKPKFGYYAATWGILFAVFQIVVFATPNTFMGLSKFGGAFWVGYLFIDLAFLGQLACAYRVFQQGKAERVFLHLPLITISYSALITTIVVGTACIVIPFLPNWLGGIVCLIIFACYAMSAVKAQWAADAVADVSESVKGRTLFIKSLTVDAESLLAKADHGNKALCKQVYEAVRYSDPMSHPALGDVEAQIALKFHALSEAIVSQTAAAAGLADELLLLIGERNKKCKLLK